MVGVLISIWSVVGGRWLMVGGLWSVVGGWSVGGGFVLRRRISGLSLNFNPEECSNVSAAMDS